jgi:hypothetical protein
MTTALHARSGPSGVPIPEVTPRPAYTFYPRFLPLLPLWTESGIPRTSQVYKQNAGLANRASHDLVQLALKKELQRLDLRVVGNDHEMRKQFSHLCSQKQGDLAILSASNFLIFDSVSRQPRSKAIADIKIVVNSQGTWTPARSHNKNKIENPGLVQQEQIKNSKHADFYAPIGFDIFPFVVSCFGSFGPTAV